MKGHEFIRHLRNYGCILKREGARHSLYQNPANGRSLSRRTQAGPLQ